MKMKEAIRKPPLFLWLMITNFRLGNYIDFMSACQIVESYIWKFKSVMKL